MLGEAGGRDEAPAGRPFVGKSGRDLRRLLAQLPSQPMVIHNMVARSIVKSKERPSVTPTAKEIRACWECHVGSLLSGLQPRLIVAVGTVASKWLCDVGVERGHGSTWPSTQEVIKGTPIFITRHPAGVMRNRQKLQPQLEGDFTTLSAILSGTSRLSRRNYVVAGIVANYSHPTVADWGASTPSSQIVAADLETSSLDHREGVVLGLSLCSEEGQATYIPGSLLADDWRRLLAHDTVWFNGTGFDLMWAPPEVRYTVVDDVMLMARVLSKPYGSLRDLAAYEYGLEHENIRAMLSRLGATTVEEVGDELAYKGCEDVDLTLRLFHLYQSELQSRGLQHIYELEKRIAPTIRRVEFGGLHINHQQVAAELAADGRQGDRYRRVHDRGQRRGPGGQDQHGAASGVPARYSGAHAD